MMKSRSVPYLLSVLGVATLYFAAARLGLSLAFLHANVSPVWPPTGLAIAMVLLLGYRISPAILLGAFLANLATGVSAPIAGGIAIGNTLEAVSAAMLLHRFVGLQSPFNRPADVVKFVLIAGMFSPMVSATIGDLTLCLGGAAHWANFGSLWFTWWLGDGVGALVVAPLVLTWIEQPIRGRSAESLIEELLLLALLSIVALVVFRGLFFSRAVNYPLGHLTIPFLLWAAFRFGPRGVATALTLLSGIAIWGTTRGYGPFAEHSLNESLLLLQVFVAALAVTSAILAAVVTEHQQALSTITLLASIVRSTADAVIGNALDGTIISWNAGAERLFGYSETEAIGRPIAMLMPPSSTDDFPRELERILRGEGMEDYETVRLRKDRREIDISLTLSPIRDAAGTVVGASAIARDITQIKRAEEERRQLLQREQIARAEAEAANRAKDEFLAILSHELRTPLGSIVGWVEILLTKTTPQHDAAFSARGLEAIKRNAGAQLRIIEDILDVSRIIAGKLGLKLVPVRLGPIIDATLADMELTAEAKEIRLRPVVHSGVDEVMGDPQRLQQIVWNLLSNAIKFTPRGGEVEIRLNQVGSELRLVVSDGGDGIPAEFLPHVFDRFRQADSSASRKFGGLGLGLAIVRHLAEAHGGTVKVQSEGLGRGAAFTVTLPCIKTRAGSSHNPSTPTDLLDNVSKNGSRLTNCRILAVDDDPDSLEVITAILSLRGASVRAAATVREALEVLHAWHPDVLVSDLGMPEETGYDLIRQVRATEAEQGGSLPAMALTAYAGTEEVAGALAAGYQMHLAKPVEPSRLVAAIEELVVARAR